MSSPAVKQQRPKALGKLNTTTTKEQPSARITRFTHVSKLVAATNTKKEKRTPTPKKDVSLEPLAAAPRKRKVVTIIGDDSESDETPSKPSLPAIKTTKAGSQPAKRGRGRPQKKVRTQSPRPQRNKRARSPSSSDSDESANNAGVLLKKLRLESSPSRDSTPFSVNTPITEDDSDYGRFGARLPKDVITLVNLHSSLLKALTLHYAHNRSNAPADLRVLCLDVERSWGQRKVTQGDIQICLGVLNFTSPNAKLANGTGQLFSLSDYGHGKICIEIDSTQHHPGRPLDEKKLNDVFRDNLNTLWVQFIATNNPDVSEFIATALPRAPIPVCRSFIEAAPVLSKGQKRLEELKQSMAIKKQEKEAKTKQQQATPEQQQQQGDVQMTNASAPKMSLLDRIRLKSLQKAASANTALTPAQLERRAALQRAPEVAAMLGMLGRASDSGFGSRVSFTMAATLEKLKDSFRMGISREEGAICVRLLAAEVAPEWVRVVSIAGRENVVVEMGCQPSKAEMERRVRDMLAT